MVRGVSCILTLVIIGFISDKVNIKILIALGFIIMGISFLMFGNLNLDIAGKVLHTQILYAAWGLAW